MNSSFVCILQPIRRFGNAARNAQLCLTRTANRRGSIFTHFLILPIDSMALNGKGESDPLYPTILYFGENCPKTCRPRACTHPVPAATARVIKVHGDTLPLAEILVLSILVSVYRSLYPGLSTLFWSNFQCTNRAFVYKPCLSIPVDFCLIVDRYKEALLYASGSPVT